MGEKISYLSFIMLFWIFITILSGYFEQDILLDSVTDLKINEETDVNNVFNILDNIPILNSFTPLFKIMFFQYSDQIPPFLSIFLILFSVLSAYLVYSMIRGF